MNEDQMNEWVAEVVDLKMRNRDLFIALTNLLKAFKQTYPKARIDAITTAEDLVDKESNL